MDQLNPKDLSDSVYFWFQDWPTARASLYVAAFLLSMLLILMAIWTVSNSSKSAKFTASAFGLAMAILTCASYLLTAYTFLEIVKFNIFLV